MKTYYPTYQNSLIQLSNSLRQYFELETYHETDKQIDEWLNHHQFQSVVVLLIDGMGEKIVQANDVPLLKQYHMKCLESVFPPTTVAATTSLQTGKTPMETGWIGWHQYLPGLSDSLLMFFNTFYHQSDILVDPLYSYHALPVSFIQNEVKGAVSLFPAWSGSGIKNFADLCQAICNKQRAHPYIYAYWDALDSLMHEVGPNHFSVAEMMIEIDRALAQLVTHLDRDTGLIVLADHGHIDIQTIYFEDDPVLMDCLLRKPSLEGRTVSFQIKPLKKERFAAHFQKKYQDTFQLFSYQEAKENHLFGYGQEQADLGVILADYIAVAIADVAFMEKGDGPMKGNHAGMTEDEMLVPCILYPSF